jgi:hypothetical protein
MNPSIHVEGYWTVRGKEFSPSAAEQITQILFSEKSEPGEICVRGRHRGKPAPEGWGKHDFSLPPEGSDLVSSNSEVLTALERCLPVYRAAGAQEVVLHFNVSYSNQCNLQLSAALIHKLANLGIDITLTCFASE